MKFVKIDFKTFLALVRYFVLDEHTEELYKDIRQALEQNRTEQIPRVSADPAVSVYKPERV